MAHYPGNFTDSDLLTVPKNLKVRPNHDTTHLAYITDSEADLLQKNKPGTPHKGPQGIPNYDGGDILTYTPSGMSGTGYQGPSQQQQQQQQQQYDRHQQQSNERQDKQDKINKDNQAAVKKAGEFATQLNKSGINTSQLGWAQSHDSVPTALASVLGIAEERWDSNTNSMRWFNKGTDEAYVPGKHKIEDFDYDWGDLGNYMTMREEGTYGGVSGNEAVINQTKNELLSAKDRMDKAATQADWDKANEEYNSALNNLDKVMGGSGITDQIFDVKTGQFKEGFGADPFTGTFADMSFRDIEETAGRYGARDPETGMLTQEDWKVNLGPETNIYQKYLNIGKNPWDDPMSGILKPRGQPYYGEPGGGWGGWGGYGGYGGGADGGYSYGPAGGPTPEQMAGFYTPQANVIQGMINVHATPTVFAKRGGIVSLLRL